MRNDGSLDELKQTLSRVLAKLEPTVSSHAARIARRPSRARVRRRRLRSCVAAAVLGSRVVAAIVVDRAPARSSDAVREITLPLRHEDIIRQQAADKHLDPALIAAVIYEESRFRDQTSHAGARGLMQITPETADFIARRSGGVRFEQADLATPADQHRLRGLVPALPDRPLRRQRDARDRRLQRGADATWTAGSSGAGGPDTFDSARHIPFPETRAYVENVQERRQQYREHYAQLGCRERPAGGPC